MHEKKNTVKYRDTGIVVNTIIEIFDHSTRKTNFNSTFYHRTTDISEEFEFEHRGLNRGGSLGFLLFGLALLIWSENEVQWAITESDQLSFKLMNTTQYL